MKHGKHIIWFTFVLAFGFVLGWNAGWRSERPGLPVTTGEVRVMVDDGNTMRTFANEPIAGETGLYFLERLFETEDVNFVTKDFSGIGTLVETIGDKSNGEDNKYWQYWVNGVFAPMGIHTYRIRPHDIMLWKFTEDQGL